jgi:K+-sensing histidine kinase KdpD
MHELFKCHSEDQFFREFRSSINSIVTVDYLQIWVKNIPFSSYRSINEPDRAGIELQDDLIRPLVEQTLLWKNGKNGTPLDQFSSEQNCLIAALFVNPDYLLGWFVIKFDDIELAKQKNVEITEMIKVAGYAYERHVLFSMMSLLTNPSKEKQNRPEEDLLTVMSGYVSQLSHQLKNPMTAIRGYSDLLTNGFLGEITPQQSRSLETVIYNLDRVNEGILVPNSIFKMYANRLQKQTQEENIGELIRQLCTMFSRTNQRTQVRMKCQVPTDTLFPTDRLFFEESFRGIIKTCMHFMEINQECLINATRKDNSLILVIHCRVDFLNPISCIDNFNHFISGTLERGNFTEMYALWKKSILLWEYIGGSIASAELNRNKLKLTLQLRS